MRLYKLFFSIGLFYLFILSQGCVNKNEEDLLLENYYCNLDTPKFANDIQPLIHANCLPCHSQLEQEGGVILDKYDDVTNYTHNGALLGTIKHESGYTPMPKSAPKLRDCEISAIEKWINQGALNN